MSARALLVSLLCALALGGCAIPSWVPWVGKKTPPPPVAAPAPSPEPPAPKPIERVRTQPLMDGVADRVIAVVNNDAITFGELLELIAAWRQENRQRTSGPSEEEMAAQFLNRIIDLRLQLQEADREKITVDEAEVAEELADRVKKLGAPTMEAFEESLKPYGVTIESLKKRVRESIRVARIVRRKVTLRVSVTDPEIDRYLEANRSKLETGLAYHARHVLLPPEDSSDAAWEAARVKIEAIRAEAVSGADFAELARRHSLDASARDGGDLGTLKRGELAQEVEAQILRLEPGEVSRPYRSSLGWHIFKLETKEVLEGEALARVRKQIQDILFREKYDARLEAWLREIKGRAIIETRM